MWWHIKGKGVEETRAFWSEIGITMNLFSGIIVSFKQDSLWSWFVCGLTTLCVILTIGFSSALGVLFPVFMNSFGENRESTGQFM